MHRDQLLVDLRFVLSGRYMEEFHKEGLSRERVQQIVSTLLLPRYVGLIRFKVAEAFFLDVVYDTTDIPRSQPAWSPVLAFIPAEDSHRKKLQNFAERYGEAVIL